MRGGVWKFKEILTYDFLYEHWIVQDRSAAAIGKDVGGSERPVFDALKRHGISVAMKRPQDLSAFLAAGSKTRFQDGQVAPMKGRKGTTPAWKGKTKDTDPVAARISATGSVSPHPWAS